MTVVSDWRDSEFFAMNTYDPDYRTTTFLKTSIDLGTGLDGLSWKVCAWGTDKPIWEGTTDLCEGRFYEPGWYEIFIWDGDGYNGYRTAYVDGYATRSFDWTFEKRSYHYSMNIWYDDVLRYNGEYDADERRCTISDTNRSGDFERGFVTWNDPYVKQLARELERYTDGMDDVEVSCFVLSFLKSIRYQSDEVFQGVADYWKFPLETLFDSGGDCEDSSVLYASIMKAMGYDTALVIFPNHAMAAVELDSAYGDHFTDGMGNRYYYVESTSSHESFGKLPANVDIHRQVPIYV